MNLRSLSKYCIGALLALGTAYTVSPVQARGTFFQRHDLVSDSKTSADHVDPNLVNAWGIAFNPYGFVWVANNHTGTSTLYDGAGNAQSLVVQIPTPADDSGGNPTGIVFNGSSGFVVRKGEASGPSRFIFATEDGVIAGWAPNVDGTHAIRAVDNSMSSGAIYKGLALSGSGDGQRLYAADFFNGRIDVYDASFAPVSQAKDAFMDTELPSGYAPFGVQAIGGDVYVTYAKQDKDRHDEVTGPGLGVVDIYDPSGHLLRRFAARGELNAPWGLALAPAGFGKYGSTLLIANFGDGRINAFDPISGNSLGALPGQDGLPIEIDGLWGIAFGNGQSNQPVDTLFFAAGPKDETQGLYGRLDPVGEPARARMAGQDPSN